MKQISIKSLTVVFVIAALASCGTPKGIGSRYLCDKYEDEEKVETIHISTVGMFFTKPWIAFFAKDLQPVAKQISSLRILSYSSTKGDSVYQAISEDVATAYPEFYYEKMASINSNGDKIEILAHIKQKKQSSKIKEVILIVQNKEHNSILVLSLKGNNINAGKIFKQYMKKE